MEKSKAGTVDAYVWLLFVWNRGLFRMSEWLRVWICTCVCVCVCVCARARVRARARV